MGRYFYLQWKRVSRYLPGAFCVALLLLAGSLFAYSMLTAYVSGSEENQKYVIALCGDVDDPFFQMGLTAVTALDSTQYTMDVVVMEEEEAATALDRGDISAYGVIPENFMNNAFSGHLIPVKLVTTSGAANMVTIFKEEVTRVITTYVVESQRGVFGLMDGFTAADADYDQDLVDDLTFEYMDVILSRDSAYEVETLGIADELQFSESLLCGLAVLLVMLSCLPFAPLMIRQDHALGRMLAAKGRPIWKQSLLDLVAFGLGLAVILGILLLVASVGNSLLGEVLEFSAVSVFVNLLPVILMAASMSFLLYSLSSDLISGVLLQFFVTLALCFVSGCMYPVYFFPEGVQNFGKLLPSAVARNQLAGIITGEFAWSAFGWLLAFSAVFFGLGAGCRIWSAKRGGR